MIHKTTSFVVM